MIEKYTGSEVTIEDEEYTIIKEEGVLAIIHPS
jgi:co-chaperonin GroES (HSP10)